MAEKKKTVVTADEMADFLKQTGFVFEMRTNEALSKQGYTCEIGSSFYDLDGETEREIDLVASKILNNINVHLIIECKQSLLDKWIFICNRVSPRFYYAVKHLPSVDSKILKEKRLFSHLHVFDRNIPLAQNYICYSVATSKKSDHLQIDECIHKLPKAVSDIASRTEPGRHLFLPIGLFSGQLFSVSYKGALHVEERPFLQYALDFKSKTYKTDIYSGLFLRHKGILDVEERETDVRTLSIKNAASELASSYQIDFVTEDGLPAYIAIVEAEVAAIRCEDWPLPTPPAATTAN